MKNSDEEIADAIPFFLHINIYNIITESLKKVPFWAKKRLKKVTFFANKRLKKVPF
ncbi:hypothetical protein [Catenibacterium sp. AM22-15]|uniref:hypothetical protein n=1 Tax=Catenibacterium sp. AM22-15 TaxID=2292991 RepID=UPI00131454BD|nr:hypothetical protein [Catenibacterium sp. AM22-15]